VVSWGAVSWAGRIHTFMNTIEIFSQHTFLKNESVIIIIQSIIMTTYKQKFNKKYGFKRDESHSLAEISRLTGYKLSGLRTIKKKGQGAFRTNPQSVRPQVKSATQWGIARVYSAVMGGKAQKVDQKHLIRK
tara:strand:- start:483 stop:878 length:396 start_codon:yes stop_codon:yes gene_type:complete